MQNKQKKHENILICVRIGGPNMTILGTLASSNSCLANPGDNFGTQTTPTLEIRTQNDSNVSKNTSKIVSILLKLDPDIKRPAAFAKRKDI